MSCYTQIEIQQIEKCFDSMPSNNHTQLKKQLSYPVLIHFFPSQVQQKGEKIKEHKIFSKDYQYFNKYSKKNSLDCLQRLKNSNYHKQNKRRSLIHPIQSTISIIQYEIPSSITYNKSKNSNINMFNRKHQSGSMKSTPSTNIMPSTTEISSFKNLKTTKFRENQSGMSIQQDYMIRSSIQAENKKSIVQIQSKINPNSQINIRNNNMNNFQQQNFKKLYLQLKSANQNEYGQTYYNQSDNSKDQITAKYVQQKDQTESQKQRNNTHQNFNGLINKQTRKHTTYNTMQNKEQDNNITSIDKQIQLQTNNHLFESFGIQNQNTNKKNVKQQIDKIKLKQQGSSEIKYKHIDNYQNNKKVSNNRKRQKQVQIYEYQDQQIKQKGKCQKNMINNKVNQGQSQLQQKFKQYIDKVQIQSEFLQQNLTFQKQNNLNQSNLFNLQQTYYQSSQVYQKQNLGKKSQSFKKSQTYKSLDNNNFCQNQQCIRIKAECEYLRKHFIDHLQNRHPKQISYKSYTLIKENPEKQSFVLSQHFIQPPKIVVKQVKRNYNQGRS